MAPYLWDTLYMYEQSWHLCIVQDPLSNYLQILSSIPKYLIYSKMQTK
jgi:hypothetical protein